MDLEKLEKATFDRKKHIQLWVLVSNPYYLYAFFKRIRDKGVVEWHCNQFDHMYKRYIYKHIMHGDPMGRIFSDYACMAANEFSERNLIPSSYCDFCPLPSDVCGPNHSLFLAYQKMTNWTIPKIILDRKTPISYDRFRVLSAVIRFTDICLRYAFSPMADDANRCYKVIWEDEIECKT